MYLYFAYGSVLSKRHVGEWAGEHGVDARLFARGAPALMIVEEIRASGVEQKAVHVFDSIASAFRAAHDRASDADRIIVFGSFLTVAAALAASRSIPEILSHS